MLALRLARERSEDVAGLMLFARRSGRTAGRSRAASISSSWCTRSGSHGCSTSGKRAPYGIKDERIRNFVIESFKSDERPIEDLFGRGGGLVFEFKQLAKDVRRGLKQIRQDVAIFHPREDDQSGLWNALTLQKNLGGMVECTVLDDCYHMVTLDRQRSIVVDRASISRPASCRSCRRRRRSRKHQGQGRRRVGTAKRGRHL